MNGGKLKPGWREGIDRLKEKDRLLGLVETDGGFSGVFNSGDSLREQQEVLLKRLELGFNSSTRSARPPGSHPSY